MADLHERPAGANATAPSSPADASKPSKSDRWSMLGLREPLCRKYPPQNPTVADLLIWALVAPGAKDPIEGIVEGVRLEIVALDEIDLPTSGGDALYLWSTRLKVAMQLLRWCDKREPMPVEAPRAPEEPRPEPEADEEDPERTHDAAPGGLRGDA